MKFGIVCTVMKMQINRLFEIIYILLDKKRVTAKELAEHFGVSRRTICRDIDCLSTAGIPVYAERGKGGGISLLPDFVLNKSILNEQEQSEILSALQGLSAVKTQDTDRVLQKLSVIFNKDTPSWMEIDYTDWSYSQGSIFHDFKIAILERRVVQFDYYNAYGQKSNRRVEPIQLWFKSRAWYIRAYCLEKQGYRVFRMSRIRNLITTNEHFTKRDVLAISTEDNSSSYQTVYVNLKLKIAPEMTYRVYDDFGDGERQEDGSHIVSVTWPEDDWVYGFILSFGEYIEVLEPEYMKEIIQEKAKKIFEKYL